jgi:hypothetical protein
MSSKHRAAGILSGSIASTFGSGLAPLLSSMSRPNKLGAVGRPVTTSKTFLPVAWYLPTNASEADQWALFRHLVTCSTANGQESIEHYQNWLITLFYFLFDNLLREYDGVFFNAMPIPEEPWNEITRFRTLMTGRVARNRADLRSYGAAASTIAETLSLPIPELLNPTEHLVENDKYEWYAFGGVVAFAASKDALTSGEHALTTRRYAALHSKYKWQAEEVPSLGGTSSPTRFFFGRLKDAWLRQSVLRRVLFTFAGRLAIETTTGEVEAFGTTTRLMQWADLAHIAIIAQFLLACPAVLHYEPLRVALFHFKEGIVQLRALCPDILDARGRPRKDQDGVIMKDTSLMPYAKLLVSDKADVAKRVNMMELLYVATRYLIATGSLTLARYTVGATFDTIYADFIQYLRELAETATRDDDDQPDEDSDAATVVSV